MTRFLGFVLIFLSIFVSRAISIEVSSLEAEKRLEFSELFPKRICDNIYDKSTFGVEKKLKEDVTLKNYFNLKRINLDEQKSTLSLFLDQRSFFYTEPKLNLIIFNSLCSSSVWFKYGLYNNSKISWKTMPITLGLCSDSSSLSLTESNTLK